MWSQSGHKVVTIKDKEFSKILKLLILKNNLVAMGGLEPPTPAL